MAHRITVITFFLSSKHIIIYDNTTLACLKMVSLVCNCHLLHLAWLWYQTGFYVEHESTMADPGESPGGPSSLLFLVQTEAQGAEKNFLRRPGPPYRKVWIRYWSMMSHDYYTYILQVSEQETSVLWKGTVCNLVLVRYWVFLQFQFSLTPPTTKLFYKT